MTGDDLGRVATYLDFPVHFTSGGGDEIRVSVRDSPAGEASEIFNVSPEILVHWRTWEAPPYSRPGSVGRHLSPPDASLHTLTPQSAGEELFNSLFTGSIRSLWDVSRGKAAERSSGLRLRLHFDLESELGRRLAACPWELLYRQDTRSFLTLDRSTPVARYFDVPRPPEEPQLPYPLRVALVSSNPDGVIPLDLDVERSRIEQSLASRRGIVCQSFRGTAKSLREAVLGFECHVLHFMGHADVHPASGRSFLVLEQGDGSIHELDASIFADLVRSPLLQLVVLNACRTGDVSEGLYGRLVPSLTLSGLKAIIAMSLPVEDEAAIAFSEGFYPALAGGDPVDVALTEGRLAIKSSGISEGQWLIPALYLRGRRAEIFRPEPSRDRPGERSRRFYERGCLALAERDFARAREALLRALDHHAGYEEAEVEYCFAVLAERGVSALTRPRAEELNRRLERLRHSSTDGVKRLALLLLAVLRHDFFDVRRLKASGPSSEEVYRLVRRHALGERLEARVAALNPSQTVRFRLRMEPTATL